MNGPLSEPPMMRRWSTLGFGVDAAAVKPLRLLTADDPTTFADEDGGDQSRSSAAFLVDRRGLAILNNSRGGSSDSVAFDNGPASSIAIGVETILREYYAACKLYGCHHHMNPGVLAALRFRLPFLRVSGSFFDADMLALAEILLRHANGALSHVRRIDLSLAATEGRHRLGGMRGIRSHGAYALSRVLLISRHIEEVILPGNRIGPYGASAIFCAAGGNPTLRTLLMRGCRVRERGARAFVSQILMTEDPTRCGLREVDLSVNQIGFYGVVAIEKALKKRSEIIDARRKQDNIRRGGDGKGYNTFGEDGMGQSTRTPLEKIEVDLEGNMIFQDVMSCVTHGLGVFLALIGTILLSKRVHGKPLHYVVSCTVFSASLIVLYLSSTLFHSFFALQRTRYIFKVFDQCAIYILIAGSYTPFYSIALHHKAIWSNALLAFTWICSLSGILVEATLPLWEHKSMFNLTMYLGMGWSCLICTGDIIKALPTKALYFLVAGGIAYTLGVPFFVRNSNLDHSIWHCFVLAGSIFHWLCVYLYVVNL